MSHFFHTAPFPCCTFLCSNLFMLHYFLVVPFSCWTFFILHNFSFVLLSCCALFMNCTFIFHFYTLQGFRFAFFSCFTLRMLQFFLLHFVQKQPPRGGALKKRCSENMQQIYRRTPILKCDINKVESNFIEITLWHGCFPVNLLHICRTPFPRKISVWLILFVHVSLFPKVYPGSTQTSKIESFAKTIYKAKPLNIVGKLSVLDAREVPTTPLLYCTFFMLHFFNIKKIENERKTRNTTKKQS